MSLADLLRHARCGNVVVRDSLSGDSIIQGSDSSVLHTVNCEEYIVEFFTAAYDNGPVIYVEVL